MLAPGQTPGSYFRNRVEDTHYDRIFIDYLGYPDIQADITDALLQQDYPGLPLLEQALDIPVVGDAWEAAQRMERFVTEPRFQEMQTLSDVRGCRVVAGRLDEQLIGSFKIFGPANALPQLAAAERRHGVITASAGNHAQGVALVSKLLGIKATIVMPKNTPAVKVEATKSFGARVELHGDNYTEAHEYSDFLKRLLGATYMEAFDNERIMTGNAFAALHALLRYPNMTHWYGPMGGGGFMGGTGRYIKAIKPEVEVVAVQVEGSDAMAQSLAQGRPVTLEHVDTYCEGTAVKKVGDKTFAAVKACVDRTLVVSREQLKCGLVALHSETGRFAEPAGALAMTGLLLDSQLANRPDAIAIAAVTGRNISAERVKELEHFASDRPYAAQELGNAALQVA